MSETLEPTALSAMEAQALVALSRTFLTAARHAVMYPAGHPTVQAAVRLPQSSLSNIIYGRIAPVIPTGRSRAG